MLVSPLEEFGLAERASPPHPSTKSSNIQITLQLSLSLSLSSCIFATYCLLKTFQVLVFMYFCHSLIKAPQITLLLPGQLHIHMPFSSLAGFRVLTKFPHCWVHQDPQLFPSPVMKLEEPISSPTPTPRSSLSFPSMFLCSSVDSLALLINYRVHLAIMLRCTVRLKRDCVAHLVCAPCQDCSVFLRPGCEIVHVLIILFYKGIKGAAGRVGPYFHSCSRSGVYSHTDFFFFLVLLWIFSIIKTVKRLL